MGKAKDKDICHRTWGKRTEVQDNAELQIRMISTVTRYFYLC